MEEEGFAGFLVGLDEEGADADTVYDAAETFFEGAASGGRRKFLISMPQYWYWRVLEGLKERYSRTKDGNTA